ncbi:MAG: DsbA family protein [Acidimicrobiales bacterium]
MAAAAPPVIEVFADVGCPFTHVGLLRLVAVRREAGREEVRLRVRAWPLELVNGTPLDPAFIAEEVADIRDQVAPDLFSGFRADHFPRTSLPAFVLAGDAYAIDDATGEAVSLAVRHALFEDGLDVADPEVLAAIAERHGVPSARERAEADRHGGDHPGPLADLAEGRRRGVIGSPHFFTPGGDFFCPALDIAKVDGHLHITADLEGFDAFARACFAR